MSEHQTILLVDDSENDVILMQRAFERAKSPCLLQTVTTGEQAIAYLEGKGSYGDRRKFPPPSIMLLDLNMPRMSGFDVLVSVRAHPRLKRLTIIILTSSRRNEDLERAFDLGATSFLVKPTNLETLTAMTRCLCEWLQVNHFPSLR